MLARRHRLALHAVGAVLMAGIAVVATDGVGQAAGTVAKPGAYGGDATAASFEFRLDKNPEPFPVTDPFHTWFPYAETSIDSTGGASSIASSLYPGQGVLGVPALLCQFNSTFCQQVVDRLPDYPLVAQAQYPTNPDARASGSPDQKPFTVGPLSQHADDLNAHADPDRVQADSVTQSNDIAGVLSAESASAHSTQTFAHGALVLTARSTVRGLTIGGTVHIDQVSSLVTAQIDGDKVGKATVDTTVSGATVANTPVVIDSTGIHVASSGDKGAVAAAVNSALKQLTKSGISVQLVGVTKKVRPTNVVASTGGLLVTYSEDANTPWPGQVPDSPNGTYFGWVNIAGAGVNANAGPGVDFSIGSVSTPTTPATTPAGPTTTGTSGAGAPPPPTNSTATTNLPTSSAPAVATPPSKPTAGRILPDLTYKRLRTLMLVLLAYPVLMLLTAPLRSPARLPRFGS